MDGQDDNEMFGRGLSNIRGASIGSGSIGMSLVYEFSGVGSCTGGSGWGFWCVAMPGDVPNEWISSARIFTSLRVAFLVYVRLSKHEMLGGGTLMWFQLVTLIYPQV